jgi:hypothetical protein
MTMHTKATYGLLGVLIASMIVGLVFWRRDRHQLDELTKRSEAVCSRLESDLDAIARNRYPMVHRDLDVWIPLHHLDEGLMQLCFGKSSVVDSRAADACWLTTDREGDCYVDLAKELLQAYRARHR